MSSLQEPVNQAREAFADLPAAELRDTIDEAISSATNPLA